MVNDQFIPKLRSLEGNIIVLLLREVMNSGSSSLMTQTTRIG